MEGVNINGSGSLPPSSHREATDSGKLELLTALHLHSPFQFITFVQSTLPIHTPCVQSVNRAEVVLWPNLSDQPKMSFRSKHKNTFNVGDNTTF